MAHDLTGAEIDMLQSLPEPLRAADMSGWTPRQQRGAKVRERLQRAGLLSVKAQPDGSFLAMITEKGVDALKACRPGGRR